VSKILVTGVSGDIGRKTLQHLLERAPVSELVGLARDPAKAADLTTHGVEIRKGDYSDYKSLVQAFGGVQKVLLISTHAFADRKTEHANLIKAVRRRVSGTSSTIPSSGLKLPSSN
jgi:NAD(P)H dehydrogenase (quinone)